MEKNNARITFKSYMYDIDEQIELIANGKHYIKDELHYVMYNEESEDGHNTRNIMKFNGEYLEVSKLGITKTNMYYKPGYRHNDRYHTPFGEYDRCIDTEKYILVVSEKRYKILVEYNLQLGGAHVSRCKVEIVIEEL